MQKMQCHRSQEKTVLGRQSSQLHLCCRVTESGDYREVIFGFYNMETNDNLDRNSFQSLMGIDDLPELTEKVNGRL